VVISGSGFGADVNDLEVSLFGPVSGCLPGTISAIDTMITCIGRLTSAPSDATGSIEASVSRAGGANNEGRQGVAFLLPSHSVATSVTPFPANGNNFLISGTNFPASVQTNSPPVKVTLYTGSQTISTTLVSPWSANALLVTLSTPLDLSYRGVLYANVSVADYLVSGAVAVVSDPPQVDASADRRIPSNSANIKLTGAGFGNSTSDLRVKLTLSPANNGTRRAVLASTDVDCLITSANGSSLICTPTQTLVENSVVDATVILFGGVSGPFRVGTTGGSVIVLSSIDTQTVAQNADTIFVYGDGFAADPDAQQNAVLLTPGGSCTIKRASSTQIECSPSAGFGSVSNVKASVSAYGAQASGPVPVIAQVVPTVSIAPSLTSILTGTSIVTIQGTGFDSSSPNATQVWLSLNNEAEFPCITASITSTSLTCTVSSPFNTSGTLTGKIRAFYGNSSVANVGKVEPAVAPTSSGDAASSTSGLATSSLIGIIVGVVAFVIIVAAIVLLVVRSRLKAIRDIKTQQRVDVPTEMAHLFSIVSSDLEIISKLGEGAYGAVYLGKYAKLKCHVAIKKLTASMIGSAVSDFFREAVRPRIVWYRSL
jgi:hypothetical protein